MKKLIVWLILTIPKIYDARNIIFFIFLLDFILRMSNNTDGQEK